MTMRDATPLTPFRFFRRFPWECGKGEPEPPKTQSGVFLVLKRGEIP